MKENKTKEEIDFNEEYGCVCCGNGYLHLADAKWFVKTIDMIEYLKSIGWKKEIKKEIIE